MRRAAPLLVIATLALASTPPPRADGAKKTVILGIDGLDPKLLQRFVDAGDLPNFRALIDKGDFKPLTTSMPPLSPIAWSNFITGMDPGGHGIYDFIHRKPDPFVPYSSMAEATEPGRILRIAGKCVPARDMAPGFLRDEPVVNLRQGKAFWEMLEEAGVPTTVYRMPVNFPPVETGGHSLAGMGVPDLRGTLGSFSYFSDEEPKGADDFTGGAYYPVRVIEGHVEAALRGPKDPFDCNTYPTMREKHGGSGKDLRVPFDVWIDPREPVVKLQVQDTELVLRQGEWSPWVKVDFEVVPYLASVSSIARFYLKEVRPRFKLYVSPLQIDPENPAQPLSTPSGWSRELFEMLGPYYTQGLPAETKALSHGVLNGREFWEQAHIVLGEDVRALDHLLRGFDEGFFFFYFSSIDQGSHMLWNYMDSQHPAALRDDFLDDGIRNLYVEVDRKLGDVMRAIDDDTLLIVMSDHGFNAFNWEVNLNTWLVEAGYMALRPGKRGDWFQNVDWTKTRAYAAGINGLYVNVRGREKQGIVEPADHEATIDALERDLLAMKDPRNGRSPVTLAFRPGRDYHGPYATTGPDVIVGYNLGYRGGWKTALGAVPEDTFVDNMDAWSGDHAIDYRLVPGVLISNHEITLDEPALYDLTVAILSEYGVAIPDNMIGKDCLGGPVRARTAPAAP